MTEPVNSESGSWPDYACPPDRSQGRVHPEPTHVYRNPYQRDRDRILHCAAFRRLESKTQVFAYHESDYVRTRLTHTLEVAQISRSIARALGLYEDLSEAIALSHDIGHPPFGHAGERALDKKAESAGGFNHNIQGLRIVDYLEQRYGDFPGLNLSFEVREAFAKHGSGRDAMPDEFAATGPQPTLEAQIVDLVDELTYTSHDIDDGITHRRLKFRDLEGLELWDRPYNEVRKRFPDAGKSIWRHETVRRIVNYLVTDLLETTRQRIDDTPGLDLDQVRDQRQPVASFSDDCQALLDPVKAFLIENLYRDYRVVQMNEKANRVVSTLYDIFVSEPSQLPPRFLERADKWGVERSVVDYIGGMTDKFALESYARLIGADSLF